MEAWEWVVKGTIFSSLLLQAIPIAPWATAGSMSSTERMLVTFSVMLKRLSPASANNVAWTTPSLSFLNLVWTLPLKFSITCKINVSKSINKRQLLHITDPNICWKCRKILNSNSDSVKREGDVRGTKLLRKNRGALQEILLLENVKEKLKASWT